MWSVFSVSTTGKRNSEQNLATQDASHFIVEHGALIATVCDGAGSALEGGKGADFVAHALVEKISTLILSNSDCLEASVQCAIETVRVQLAECASTHQLVLSDYACTLVGCVVTPQRGFFFHVGDGFAIVQNSSGDSILSAPENGEYADETYFVTDENWKQHLRVTPIPESRQGCMIGLMSDGTAPFAVNRARSGFFRPFIDPIEIFLRAATAPIGNQALQNLLESPRALEISHDDKTLLLAFFT